MQPVRVNPTCSNIYLVDLLEWIVNLLLVTCLSRMREGVLKRPQELMLHDLSCYWFFGCIYVSGWELWGANVPFWLKVPRVVIFLPPTTLKNEGASFT